MLTAGTKSLKCHKLYKMECIFVLMKKENEDFHFTLVVFMRSRPVGEKNAGKVKSSSYSKLLDVHCAMCYEYCCALRPSPAQHAQTHTHHRPSDICRPQQQQLKIYINYHYIIIIAECQQKPDKLPVQRQLTLKVTQPNNGNISLCGI